MNPSPQKRPRSDTTTTTTSTDTTWSNLKEWIRSTEGGFCHESLTWDATTRRLSTLTALEADTRLLVIPAACCVTATDDATLAWTLVTQSTQLYKAYWDSLQPVAAIYKALPRAWPTALQTTCLQGSPLLARVQAQPSQVQAAYDRLKETHAATSLSNMPTLSEFDQALAVVTSRAFAGPNPTTTCCVPLLDLCNHTRGRKNLRYAWDGGMLVVHTVRPLAAGAPCVITYGAQSNAQLLLNYGFCLENNREPDGSSNDIVEFSTNAANDSVDDKPILLRLGPPSYTYGPLVKVLEALGPVGGQKDEDNSNDEGGDGNDGGDDDMDDMEAFLNGCEEDNEDACDDACLYTAPTSGPENDGKDDEAEDQKSFDKQALRAFLERLEALLQAYPKTLVTQPDASRTRYANILLQSEQEILRFYQTVSQRILERLMVENEKTMAVLPDAHAQQLIEAFFRIRYTMLL